jgi:hypothetical protein
VSNASDFASGHHQAVIKGFGKNSSQSSCTHTHGACKKVQVVYLIHASIFTQASSFQRELPKKDLHISIALSLLVATPSCPAISQDRMETRSWIRVGILNPQRLLEKRSLILSRALGKDEVCQIQEMSTPHSRLDPREVF